MELLTICAILLGPFFGIFVHGKLEDRKITYERKLDIFKILMATRATPLARAHVESLNRIDIEFTGRREKKIRDAWAVLLNHYEQHPKQPPSVSDQARSSQDKDNSEHHLYQTARYQWREKVVELHATRWLNYTQHY